MSIFERLKRERERLALTQPRLAELAGVGKTTVINWEKGASAPDAIQLAAIAAAGADVLYILTGQRSQAATPQAELPPRERALLENYQNTDADGQRHIESTALFAAKSAAKTGRKKAA